MAPRGPLPGGGASRRPNGRRPRAGRPGGRAPRHLRGGDGDGDRRARLLAVQRVVDEHVGQVPPVHADDELPAGAWDPRDARGAAGEDGHDARAAEHEADLCGRISAEVGGTDRAARENAMREPAMREPDRGIGRCQILC